ncbi:hypothetical protein TSUD_152100 [Trifolium subterraneum]|uniref:Transmembrane protein n=1 Tax=Trifolium subterraneum TaxID=3900 RepID=A0A2Z6NAQ3_TRISU|nr:hypothetical protein TSUD_152100 [Trifolium subterraneum]
MAFEGGNKVVAEQRWLNLNELERQHLWSLSFSSRGGDEERGEITQARRRQQEAEPLFFYFGTLLIFHFVNMLLQLFLLFVLFLGILNEFFKGDMVERFMEICYWDVAIANKGHSRFGFYQQWRMV